LKLNGRLIALGVCAAIGAAFAVPSIVGADAPAPLALNSQAVNGYKVSPTGSKAGSLVPTDSSGRLPDRIVPAAKLKPGQTMYGSIGTQWVAAAAGGVSGASASFPFPLPRALPLTNFGILGGASEDPECVGSFEKPTAPAGHLCVYPGNGPGFFSVAEAEISNIQLNGEGNLEVSAYLMSGKASRYGFRIEATALATGAAKFFASWAYTAPGGSTTTS
jgi:hypothetical protein